MRTSASHIALEPWAIDPAHYPVIGFGVGALLVVLYGARYFSETKIALNPDQTEEVELLPFTAQASTVRGRFVFWQWAFCCSLVAIYLVLLAVVGGASLPAPTAAMTSMLGILAPLLTTKALVLALIVTGAIPNTPILSRALELLRKWMHSRARIPERFSSIYHALQTEITASNDDLRIQATARMPGVIQTEDFENTNLSARYWLSRTLYLRAFIEQLRMHDPRKAVYLRAFEPYAEHIKRVDVQLAESRGLYDNLAEIPPAHLDLLRRRLRGQCLRLVQVCIAVVFATEYSDARALEKLSALNPDVEEHVHPSPPYDFYIVSCIILFVMAFTLIGAVDFYRARDQGVTREAFRHAFIGAFIATMIMPMPGVLVAVAKNLFQGLWPYRLPGQRRQLLPYVCCAAGAYLFTVAVLWGFVAGGFTEFETLGNRSIPGFGFVGAAFGLVSALCIDASRELWSTFTVRTKALRVAVYTIIAFIITTIGSLVAVASAIGLSDAPTLQGTDAKRVFWEFASTSIVVVGGLTLLHVPFTLTATKRKIRFHSRRDLKRFILNQARVPYEERAPEARLDTLISTRCREFPEELKVTLLKAGLIAKESDVLH